MEKLLKEIGLKYFGGTVTEFGGVRYSGHIRSQYFIPEVVTCEYPVVFIPGMALSSDIYISTPLGEQGIALDFVDAGYKVFVADEANSGASGFDISVLLREYIEQNGLEDLPKFIHWTMERSWCRWGLGSTTGELYENHRMHGLDKNMMFRQFVSCASPAKGGPFNDVRKIDALEVMLKEIGPCILVAHSAAGSTAHKVALRCPELVKGIVALESAFVPGCSEEIAENYKNIGILSIFADYIDERQLAGADMAEKRNKSIALTTYLKDKGCKADIFILPEMGIKYNSHMFMVEENKLEIVKLIMDWVKENI